MGTRITGSILLLSSILLVGARQTPMASPRGQSFIPAIPTVIKTSVALPKAIAIPGDPLASTDLIWADEATKRVYFADRSNFAIDIIDGTTDSYAGRITGFIGLGGATGQGPNGLLVTPEGKLWAGDGNSLVQVVDLKLSPPRIIQTISVGGTNRADELGYDPDDHIILIGNDRDTPPYV